MYVEEQDDVPWDTLNVIVADVTYGGRVTDVWDKRTIASIMRLYFDPGLLDDSYRFRYADASRRLRDNLCSLYHATRLPTVAWMRLRDASGMSNNSSPFY